MQTTALIRYFLIPLRTSPLLLMGSFVVLLALGLRAGLLGLPLLIIVVSWFFKYSFVLLDSIVEGRREPPVLSLEMVNPVEQRPLGMLCAIGAFYWLTLRIEPAVGSAAVHALQIGGLLLLPAMVAVTSITGRFFAAFNPAAVFAVVARAPSAYATLLACIGALWSIPYLSIRYAITWAVPGAFVSESASIPILLLYALAMYLWLAMCACIGGLIYEHREQIGYEPNESPERSEARSNAELERERDKIMDGIFAEYRGHALTNAGASVRKIIDGSHTPLTEFRWLYARAAKWPDPRLAGYLVQHCLPTLLQARANGEALDLVRERLRVDPTFRPASAAHVLQMVALARDGGDKSTARQLLRDFEARFPGDPAVPLAAKLNADIAR